MATIVSLKLFAKFAKLKPIITRNGSTQNRKDAAIYAIPFQ